MKKLILTNLENFDELEADQYKLLGPWCLLGDVEKEDLIEDCNFEPLFSSHISLKKAADYVLDFSFRLILELSRELNKIFGREYSVVYWQILLMPSVLIIVQTFYERHLQLQRFLDKNTNGDGFEVDLMDISISPDIVGTRECMRFFLEPEGNHYVYSVLILAYKNCDLKINKNFYKILNDKNKLVNHRQEGVRRYKRIVSEYISSVLAKISSVYIDSIPGMSLIDQIMVSLHLAKSKNKKNKLRQTAPINVTRRNNQEKLQNLIIFSKKVQETEFESVVSNVLPALLPEVFLSKFYSNEKRSEQFIRRLGDKVTDFVLGPLIGGYDPMKFIVALHKERGGKLIINQHGAIYGTASSFPVMAGIEYAAADKFITWGWEKQGDIPVQAIPLPSPLLSKLNHRANANDNGKLILVTTLVRVYSDRLASNPQPEECYGYRASKKIFFEALSQNLRSNLLYRPYFTDLAGLSDRKYMLKECDGLKVFDGNLVDMLKTARCIVMDHPGTTMNMSMVMNTPTIAFWDLKQWVMCDEAAIIFKKLVDVGILYNDPANAAKFLEKKWSSIREWWGSDEVQMVRLEYCRYYARYSDNWKKQWIDFLIDVS